MRRHHRAQRRRQDHAAAIAVRHHAPTRGEIEVNGRIAPILALGAGFDGSLTGRENAIIGGAILGLSRKSIMAKLDAIADFAEIGMFFDQPMKLYSSGMVARLAFAICAHVDADIPIVDEALSVGDEAFAKKCEEFIEGFSKRGTILVVSHGLDYLKTLCNRVVWIDAGQVREVGIRPSSFPITSRPSARTTRTRSPSTPPDGQARARPPRGRRDVTTSPTCWRWMSQAQRNFADDDGADDDREGRMDADQRLRRDQYADMDCRYHADDRAGRDGTAARRAGDVEHEADPEQRVGQRQQRYRHALDRLRRPFGVDGDHRRRSAGRPGNSRIGSSNTPFQHARRQPPAALHG